MPHLLVRVLPDKAISSGALQQITLRWIAAQISSAPGAFCARPQQYALARVTVSSLINERRILMNWERKVQMKYCLVLLVLVGFATTATLTEGFAQTGAGRGAVSGAIIGGAVGGRRGAAIGATAGAIAGANRHRHWHAYYWRHGQCWYRARSGRSHPVSHRYCR
jgi:hypothetical protein